MSNPDQSELELYDVDWELRGASQRRAQLAHRIGGLNVIDAARVQSLGELTMTRKLLLLTLLLAVKDRATELRFETCRDESEVGDQLALCQERVAFRSAKGLSFAERKTTFRASSFRIVPYYGCSTRSTDSSTNSCPLPPFLRVPVPRGRDHRGSRHATRSFCQPPPATGEPARRADSPAAAAPGWFPLADHPLRDRHRGVI